MRVLIAALGSLGDLHPHLSVGLAMANRGHAVTVATSAAYRDRVDQLGLAFLAMPPDVPDIERQPGLVREAMDARRGTERVVRRLVLPWLREAWTAVEREAGLSDVVVSGLLAFSARLAAERHGVPWVSTALQPSVMFSAVDPPLISGIPAAGMLRRMPPVIQRAALAGASVLADHWVEPLVRFRAELGLPPFEANPLLIGQHSPLLSVALFSPVFAPRRPDWPRQVVECGFPFDPRVDGGAIPEGLASFLDSGPVPVVFTLGSAASLEPGDFIEQSARAAHLLGTRAVILSGRDGAQGVFPGDDRIWLEPWLAHAAIFPRGCAVVHQGGIGTLSHALAAGKPMVVVPHAHDQPDNARRAEALGVARVLPRARYRADRAARAIGLVLGDPGFTVRARDAAASIAGERGGEVAAIAIEQVLHGR